MRVGRSRRREWVRVGRSRREWVRVGRSRREWVRVGRRREEKRSCKEKIPQRNLNSIEPIPLILSSREVCAIPLTKQFINLCLRELCKNNKDSCQLLVDHPFVIVAILQDVHVVCARAKNCGD
jgi:hypothetical protein